MANTGFKGLDVRQTGNQLVFRAFLQTSAGALLGTGTTVVSLIELQSDGTIKSYDFNDNTFKTTALTTPTLALTHRPSNNAGTTTGFWTAVLATLTGFTVGGVYQAIVNNSGASPTDQMREFQYGSAEGDLQTTANGTGVANLSSDAKAINAVSTSAVTTVKAVQGLAVDGVITTVTNQLALATIVSGIWQDTTAGDFTTALSIGKSVMNGVTLGAGLTVNAVTGLTASNLDAAITSRMATYIQPTGFLAATFPATIASTTNITGGTITTVTNLTNAPTSGDLTNAMKTSVTAAATAATPIAASVAGAVGSVTGLTASNLDATVSSRLSTANSPDNYKKNTAVDQFAIPMRNTDGTLFDGLASAISVVGTIDGVVSNPSGTIVKAATGRFYIPMSPGDMDGNVLCYMFTASGCIPRDYVIRTQP